MARIPSQEGTLAGLHYSPDQSTKEVALVCSHGFTSGKYSLDGLVSYLALKGYEGLTFDFVGHKLGGTGGEMRSMSQAVENVHGAVDWMQKRFPEKRIVLLGHSMGAAASLAVASRDSEVAGVIALCMGTEPMLGFQGVVGRTMQAQRRDYVQGAPVEELMQGVESLLPLLGELKDTPALFVAARQDVLFSVERVSALAQLSGTNTRFETIDATHLDAPDRAKSVVLSFLTGL